MILITLGTQKFQFNRLLKKIDLLIENNVITEEVVAQTGFSTYIPQHYEYKDFFDKDEFKQIIEKADLVITHSGVGTIIKSLDLNKPVIVVPRLHEFSEHVDDHQLEIAESFSNKKFVLSTDRDIDNLEKCIAQLKKTKFKKYKSSNKKIQKTIMDYIEREC